MEKMKFQTLIFSLLISFFCAFSYGASSVWKASKGGKHFYLGGTIHLLKPSDHPLPQEFTEAYQDSDTLIFETDIDGSNSIEAQQKFMQAMMIKTGDTLQDKLNAKTYQKLSDFLAARGIPIITFQQLEPWAAAVSTTVMEYQLIGMQPEYGVDNFFSERARTDGKPILSLESIDDQISYLASMGNIEPNVMIEYTLKDLESLPEFTEFLKTSWRSGDVEAFTKHSMIAQMKSEFPNLYKTLITNRNNNWMKQLLMLNNNDATEFVLVGTMHLNDREGLLSQLKASGYKLEQI